MNQEPTAFLEQHGEYAIFPEKNGEKDGFGVIHQTKGSELGCIRFAETLAEAREIIEQLKRANA